jgi:predicted cupin superfamily sugar epimerase
MTPPNAARARELIDTLELAPHPERGYYAETHRALERVTSRSHLGDRAASTAIYFLVSAERPVTFLHRLASDEVFHLYEGGPLDVLRLLPDGTWDVPRLGLDLQRGERPQLVMTRGTWFGTELDPAATHCLIGCTVAPGFEFADFELADAAALLREYPGASDRIRRMRRPGELER